jgi:Tfp pilus assembly protein PilF/TolB-like protein
MVWRMATPSVTAPASIAIMRFSGATEEENGLALSLAENLKNALTATGKVDVRDARPSSAPDRVATARGISAETFLTGTVKTTAYGVQSTVSLVRVRDNRNLWTGTFEGGSANWFALQDRAASELLGALWREPPMVQHHTADPVADQLYWRGRFTMQGQTPDAFRAAGELFHKAAIKDPADALAWAGLADASLQLSEADKASRGDALLRVRAGAKRAIELDPTIPQPHTSLGLVAENYDWDWPEAELSFRRAVTLDPKNADAHHWYGEFLVLTGHIDTGLAELKSAEHLEPLSPEIESDYAKCLYLARRYDEAIAKARSALAADPQAASPHRWLADSYLRKGMLPEFSSERRRLAAPGTSFAMARAVTETGNKEKAFELLEKALADHDAAMISVKMDPVFDPLHSDPRYQLLLSRLHLR